ncbi:MAG TPA: hypothetical protein VLF59_05970 [Candidatus Saccharimonadales bacterium]|nr:hypothetical protein [Candidatus Saccharimonadales bacterium]
MAGSELTNFEVGTILNPLHSQYNGVEPIADVVQIDYPARLSAMLLDPSRVTSDIDSIYPAGQLMFSAGIHTNITARLTESGEITVTKTTPRAGMVRHAGLLVQKALGFTEGVELDVQEVNFRHSGLGTSGATLAGSMAAVNELFGKPIHPLTLARHSVHNYGEEIDGDDSQLVHVKSIGGSALCGAIEGGLIITAGEAVPIYQKKLPEELKIVLGVPSDFEPAQAEMLMRAEADMSGSQISAGTRAPGVAYKLIHEVLPGLILKDLDPLKSLIFAHRWDRGSIERCSFMYPRMTEIAESLRDLQHDSRAAIISLSSLGPAFFGLTEDPPYLRQRFSDQGMETLIANVHNGTYTVH